MSSRRARGGRSLAGHVRHVRRVVHKQSVFRVPHVFTTIVAADIRKEGTSSSIGNLRDSPFVEEAVGRPGICGGEGPARGILSADISALVGSSADQGYRSCCKGLCA